MGERIGASIQFGGKLPKQHVQELVDLLNAEGLTPDFDETGDVTAEDDLSQNFGDWEVNYGNLDDLEAFGQEHGLHYKHWYDSGPEWSACTELYDPATNTMIELVDAGGLPAMNLGEIKRLGSIEAIEAYFAKFSEPLPPLEIV
jgi:hypothetical protein